MSVGLKDTGLVQAHVKRMVGISPLQLHAEAGARAAHFGAISFPGVQSQDEALESGQA